MASASLLKTLEPDEVRAALLDLAEQQPQTRKALLMLLERREAAQEEADAIGALHDMVDEVEGDLNGGVEDDVVAEDDTALMAKVNGHLFCASVVGADNCAHCGDAFTSGEVDNGGESCECTACKVAVHRKCIPYTDICMLEKERKKSRRVKIQSARGSVVTGLPAAANGTRGGTAATAVVTKAGEESGETEEEEDETTEDSDDGAFDEVSENSSDGEGNSSDDDEGRGRGGSSDAAAAPRVGAPIKVSLNVEPEKEEKVEEAQEPANAFSRHRKHGRTGAAEDWKKHTVSFRKRISGSRKLDYVHLAHAIGNEQSLAHEFEQIPENRARMDAMPKRTDDKNRYFNILPNNHSRVVLSRVDDDETTEYINANFVAGYEGSIDRYIAAQGPLERTIGDFWRMIWEFNIPVIVMNTNLFENDVCKCDRYWPEKIGEKQQHANVEVELASETQTCPQYVTSKLKLRDVNSGKTREVMHLWWRDWPDKGVPEGVEGLFPFITTAREMTDAADAGPMLVHCSAGVGRTGCFINIDISMQQWDKEGYVDVLGNVCRMRRNRGLSVQTAVQYQYIHTALLEYMRSSPRPDQPESMKAIDVKTLKRRRNNSGRGGSGRGSGRGSGSGRSGSGGSGSGSQRPGSTSRPGSASGLRPGSANSLRRSSVRREGGSGLSPSMRLGSIRTERLPSVAAARSIFEAAAAALAKQAEEMRPRANTDMGARRVVQASSPGAVDVIPEEGPGSGSGSGPAAGAGGGSTKDAKAKRSVSIRADPNARVKELRAQWSPKTMRRKSSHHGFRSMKRRGKKAVLAEDKGALGDHEFNTRTYVRDTLCDVCEELLHGLAQQGMRCKRCKANVHHYCLADAPAVCQYRGAAVDDSLPQWPPRQAVDEGPSGEVSTRNGHLAPPSL